MLLLGSILDSSEMLVVSLGNSWPEGKQLSLEIGKSSLQDEEACQKDKEVIFDSKALVNESEAQRGKIETGIPRTRKSQEQGQSQGRGLRASIVGSLIDG